MVEETVEQIKTKQLIDLLGIGVHLSQVNNFPPLVIGGLQSIMMSMVKEYNETYFPVEETIIKEKAD